MSRQTDITQGLDDDQFAGTERRIERRMSRNGRVVVQEGVKLCLRTVLASVISRSVETIIVFPHPLEGTRLSCRIFDEVCGTV
jgi:hypothetical protein